MTFSIAIRRRVIAISTDLIGQASKSQDLTHRAERLPVILLSSSIFTPNFGKRQRLNLQRQVTARDPEFLSFVGLLANKFIIHEITRVLHSSRDQLTSSPDMNLNSAAGLILLSPAEQFSKSRYDGRPLIRSGA